MAIPVLLEVLRDREPAVRLDAAKALERMGAAAQEALVVLQAVQASLRVAHVQALEPVPASVRAPAAQAEPRADCQAQVSRQRVCAQPHAQANAAADSATRRRRKAR